MPPLTVAALILAAGKSERMRSAGASPPKPLLRLPGGETFLQRAARNLDGIATPLAVLGHASGRVAPHCGELGLDYCVNEAFESGQTSSLKTGIRRIPEKTKAFLIYPVDCAGVRRETILALVRAGAETEQPIVVPTFGGRGGHPVLVSTRLAAEFLELEDDEPAFRVIRRDPGRVIRLPVNDPEILTDVDTPDDYRDLLQRGSTLP